MRVPYSHELYALSRHIVFRCDKEHAAAVQCKGKHDWPEDCKPESEALIRATNKLWVACVAAAFAAAGSRVGGGGTRPCCRWTQRGCGLDGVRRGRRGTPPDRMLVAPTDERGIAGTRRRWRRPLRSSRSLLSAWIGTGECGCAGASRVTAAAGGAGGGAGMAWPPFGVM